MAAHDLTHWAFAGSGTPFKESPGRGVPTYQGNGPNMYGSSHWPACGARQPNGEPLGILLCCHGFKGYKDYGFFPKLCDAAAARGLLAMRFNFSHSGITGQADDFDRPELFERDTWSRQVNDLRRLRLFADCPAHAPARGGWPDREHAVHLPIVFFGHSRGGVSALLTAAQAFDPVFYGPFYLDFGGSPPDAIITAAAPDYACNLDDLQKAQLRAEGRLLSPSGRTGQDLYIGRGWLEEIEQDPELYDPVLAAAYVKCPMLILHGDADPTVSVDCAHNLHRAATPHSRLEIIAGANHVFNCPNPVPPNTPYDQLPAETRKLIELSVGFAVDCCKKARASG